jgi:hypothetical protein
MSEDKLSSEQIERRSAAEIVVAVGAVATPIALVAQPIVEAWANQHLGQGEKPHENPSPPQSKKD